MPSRFKNTKEPWIKGRLKNILFGIFCVAFALWLKSGEGEFYTSHYGFPVSRSTWTLWFVFGMAILIFGIIKKEKENEFVTYTLICTECYKLHKPSDSGNRQCKNCDGTLQNIKEFNTRNPNFKFEYDQAEVQNEKYKATKITLVVLLSGLGLTIVFLAYYTITTYY